MADPVSLVFVDEDDLVGLRDRLCTASVLYVRAAIGEHQMRRRDAFLSALVPAYALAHHVPYRHRIGRQEGASVKVSHAEASGSSRRSIATSRHSSVENTRARRTSDPQGGEVQSASIRPHHTEWRRLPRGEEMLTDRLQALADVHGIVALLGAAAIGQSPLHHQ